MTSVPTQNIMSRIQELSPQNELAFNQETETETERESWAREIAGKGNYEKIARELINSGLIEREKYRVREKYHRVFDALPEVNDRDLEMFTILDLYHRGTAEHCAETYLLAKTKIEKRLASGVVLRNLFEREFVSTEEFFRASLLHDIGKVEIPRFIIGHTMNDDAMNIFLRGLVVDEHDPEVIARLKEATHARTSMATAEELDAYLKENHLRSVHFVPARMVLSPSELEELEERELDAEMSLMDIIRGHEEFSKSILESVGLPVESGLAGLHHNYQGSGSRYPLAFGSLHMNVDVEEFLHLADVEQALTATRGYKRGFSKPRVLRIIMEEVECGRIPGEAAYLWVDDEIHEFKLRTPENEISLDDDSDLHFVQEQLQKIRISLNDDSIHDGHWRKSE